MGNLGAGELDRRIALYTRSLAVDTDSGQPKETFALLGSCWAQLMPRSVNERYSSDAIRSATIFVWQIRFRTDITVMDEIEYGSKRYRILGLLPVGRKDMLEVTTELYE